MVLWSPKCQCESFLLRNDPGRRALVQTEQRPHSLIISSSRCRSAAPVFPNPRSSSQAILKWHPRTIEDFDPPPLTVTLKQPISSVVCYWTTLLSSHWERHISVVTSTRVPGHNWLHKLQPFFCSLPLFARVIYVDGWMQLSRAPIIDQAGFLSSLCVTNKIIWSEVNTQRPNDTNCLQSLRRNLLIHIKHAF